MSLTHSKMGQTHATGADARNKPCSQCVRFVPNGNTRSYNVLRFVTLPGKLSVFAYCCFYEGAISSTVGHPSPTEGAYLRG